MLPIVDNHRIVGVVADSKYDSLRKAVRPTVFHPYVPASARVRHVVARTSVAAGQLRARIFGTVAAFPPDVPVTMFRTQREQINETIGIERLMSEVVTLFSFVVLLLGCVGLYGVTSYAVAHRTGEMAFDWRSGRVGIRSRC